MADRISWATVTETMSQHKFARPVCHAVTFVAIGTLLIHAGLIPLGAWQDEYFAFAVQRQQGFLATWHRMLQWSPRPLSEPLIYFYGNAVKHWNRPLIAYALGPFWLILIAAVLWPSWRVRNNRLTALVLLVMLLLGHRIAEVFYWPFAAIAYLPTAAAVAALLALDWGDWLDRRAGAIWIAAALTLGATCSEVGAMFCAIYAPMIMLVVRRTRPRFALLLTGPLILALLVLYLEFHTRVAQGAEIFGDPTIAHHPLQVLLSLLRTLPWQILIGAEAPGSIFAQCLPALASKFAFFMGVYLTVGKCGHAVTQNSQRMRAALAVAALLTAAVTLAAAFYNFGVACCERHDTLRQIDFYVALGSLASMIAAYRPADPAMRWLGHLALLLAMMIPLILTFPALTHDYREYAAILHARHENWQSGNASGKDMQLFQAPAPQVVNDARIAPGVYRIDGFRGLPNVMLIYFNKETLTVHPEESKR